MVMHTLTLTHTDTHSHRSLTDEWSHQCSQQIGSQTLSEKGLKEKSFDKESVSLSPLDKTKAYVHSVELWGSERGTN